MQYILSRTTRSFAEAGLNENSHLPPANITGISIEQELDKDGNFMPAALESLKGCPKVIEDDLKLEKAPITSLEHSPDVIKGVFDLSGTAITSLRHCTPKVGTLIIGRTDIDSLEFCPDTQRLYVSDCPRLTSLKHLPEGMSVVTISRCPLETLADAPKKATMLVLCDCGLESVESFGGPREYAYLDVSDNPIKNFAGFENFKGEVYVSLTTAFEDSVLKTKLLPGKVLCMDISEDTNLESNTEALTAVDTIAGLTVFRAKLALVQNRLKRYAFL